MARLTKLPNELILILASYLPMSDVLSLLGTSKHLHEILETYPWRDLNFHTGCRHEREEAIANRFQNSDSGDQNLLAKRYQHGSDLSDAKQRSLHGYTSSDAQMGSKEHQFLKQCCKLKLHDHEKWKRCREAVLILHIDLYSDCLDLGEWNISRERSSWELILSFTNLVNLCIYGRRSIKGGRETPHPQIAEGVLAFPNLRYVTIQEYVPSGWLQQLLSAAHGLTHLDLKLIQPPSKGVHFPAAGQTATEDSEWDLDPYDSGRPEKYVFACSPLPLSISLSQLTSIRHIYLCKPAALDDQGHETQVLHNMNLERIVLKEWAELVKVAKPTLEELVFDLRYVVVPFTCVKNHGRLDPGAERFMEMVLMPVFFGNGKGGNAEWPRLKTVKFCGIGSIEEFLPDVDARVGGDDADVRVGGKKRLAERLGSAVKVEYIPRKYSFDFWP